MTAEQAAESGIVPLRATEVADEVHLEAAEAPAYVDITAAPQRRPIIPEPLRRGNLRGTIRHQAGLRWHQSRYHGLRLPWYALVTAWHAFRGTIKLIDQVLNWWHWTAGWALESQAVAAGRAGHHEAMRAHTQGLKTRAARGRIVAVCLGALALGVVVMVAVTLGCGRYSASRCSWLSPRTGALRAGS